MKASSTTFKVSKIGIYLNGFFFAFGLGRAIIVTLMSNVKYSLSSTLLI